MQDWDEGQLERIERDIGVSPSVLDFVIRAYNALLKGDTESFFALLRSATNQEGMALAFGGPVRPYTEVSRSRAVCVIEIARRWGLHPVEASARLDAVANGDIEPPYHLLEEDD